MRAEGQVDEERRRAPSRARTHAASGKPDPPGPVGRQVEEADRLRPEEQRVDRQRGEELPVVARALPRRSPGQLRRVRVERPRHEELHADPRGRQPPSARRAAGPGERGEPRRPPPRRGRFRLTGSGGAPRSTSMVRRATSGQGRLAQKPRRRRGSSAASTSSGSSKSTWFARGRPISSKTSSREATMRAPAAAASTTGSPKPSKRVGKTTARAPARRASTSSRGTNPRWTTSPLDPQVPGQRQELPLPERRPLPGEDEPLAEPPRPPERREGREAAGRAPCAARSPPGSRGTRPARARRAAARLAPPRPAPRRAG